MKRTSYGRNGGPVDREGCGVPQNGRNGPPMIETGVLFIGRGVRTAKWDSTGYCLSPPSTSSILHGLLFIQPPSRATPPATVQPPLHGHPSTVYCSSSPPHHEVLFNHPSMATPPPSTVHPALHTTGSCSSRGNATAHCSSKPSPPPQRSLFIPEAASIGFS